MAGEDKNKVSKEAAKGPESVAKEDPVVETDLSKPILKYSLRLS